MKPPPVAEFHDWQRRWVESHNDHDLDALASMVTEDVVWSDPVTQGVPARGRDELRGLLAASFLAFPDLRVAQAAPYLDAEGRRFAVRWRLVGTFTGGLRMPAGAGRPAPPSISPTGARFDICGIDLYEFRDGLLCEAEIVHDQVTLLTQLGLLPGPDSLLIRCGAAAQRLTAPLARWRNRSHAKRHL